MKTKTEPRFDVVIYNYETRIIESIAGEDMRCSGREGSYSQSAEKRVDTVLPRLNDSYGVMIVATGKFNKGDKLPTDAEADQP